MTTNPDFNDSLEAFGAGEPHAPLRFPQTEEAMRVWGEAARATILAASVQGKVALVERCVAFVMRVAEQTKHPEHRAAADWAAGLAWLNRDARISLEHLDKALAFYEGTEQHEEVGRIQVTRAAKLSELGRLAQAEQAIAEAIKQLRTVKGYPYWAVVYLNFSFILGGLGRYSEMRAKAQKARRHAQRIQKQLAATMAQADTKDAADLLKKIRHAQTTQAQALINEAIAALFLGAFDAAEAGLRKAASLAQSAEVKSPEVAGQALLNLARLALARAEFFAALRLLTQAREQLIEAQVEIELATVALDEATLYERLHMPVEARRAAVQAARAFEAAGLPAETVEAWLGAARLTLAREEPTKGRRYLQAAQTALSRLEPPSPFWEALVQGYTAHPALHRTSAQRRAALDKAQAAAARLQETGAIAASLEVALIHAALEARLKPQQAQVHYTAIAAQAQAHSLVALEQQAWVGLAQGRRLADAYEPLQRAVALGNQARQNMPVEELKATLLSGSAGLARQLVAAQLQRRQPHDALQTLWEAKGGLWGDLARPALPRHTDPEWISLKTQLAYWQTELLNTPKEGRGPIQTRLWEIERALAALTRQQSTPREPLPLPTLADVQANHPAGGVAVEYLVGPQRVWACLVTRDRIRWVTLAHTRAVKALVRSLGLTLLSLNNAEDEIQRLATSRAQQAVMDALLAELHTALVAPLERFLPSGGHLILAPDDFLFGLPWTALHAPAPQTPALFGPSLGARYQVALVPSVVLCGWPGSASQGSQPGAPLLFGYAGDPPLLHVAQELDDLQRLLPASHCYHPATLADLSWTQPPRYLHLAAHGHINAQTPLLSHLALADGPLRLADALALPLHGTEVVTLSACETAVLPERGGVVLALAGAFLVAGAQTVLASLWAVDDQATSLLMTEFYRHLGTGLAPPAALQAAQAAVRAAGYAHPYYWGAFQPLSRTTPRR